MQHQQQRHLFLLDGSTMTETTILGLILMMICIIGYLWSQVLDRIANTLERIEKRLANEPTYPSEWR